MCCLNIQGLKDMELALSNFAYENNLDSICLSEVRNNNFRYSLHNYVERFSLANSYGRKQHISGGGGGEVSSFCNITQSRMDIYF